jgi:hypothetical protein
MKNASFHSNFTFASIRWRHVIIQNKKIPNEIIQNEICSDLVFKNMKNPENNKSATKGLITNVIRVE